MKPLLLSALLILGLVSCQRSETKLKQTLTLNLAKDAQTLDPRKARSMHDINLLKNLFEGLTRIGSDGTPEFALASHCDISEDGTIYTFKLRPSSWSNNTPLTANDFIYAWTTSLNPSFCADNAFQLYPIKNAKSIRNGEKEPHTLGLSSPDDHTLVIELEQPTPYLLQLLANPIYFPICSNTDSHWAEKPSSYVCNGPFTLASWKHNDQLTLQKNPNYWDHSHVHLTQINFIMIAEEAELNLFQQGELDWAGSPFSTVPVDAFTALRKKQLLRAAPYMGTQLIRLNTLKPPLDDPSVRRALALALNRTTLVEHVTQGGETPTTGLVPHSLNIQNEPYFNDNDLQNAKDLIASKKLKTLILTYSASEKNNKLVQAIQDQWKTALNVDIQLEAVERKVYFSRMSNQDYQLSIGSWIADFADPINFLNVFKTKTVGTNNTHWENDDYISLLDKSDKEQNHTLRQDLLAKAEALMMSEMPIIPLYTMSMLYLQNPKLGGVVLSSMGSIDFKTAYFRE